MLTFAHIEFEHPVIGNRRKITFSSIPIFSSVRKKIEKNFWDMEMIGNRRKIHLFKVKLENLSEEETILNFPSGNYSVTGFWINLERKVMSHFLQIFLPSGSFVMVSWISFLMPLDAGERAGKVFQSTYFLLAQLVTLKYGSEEKGSLLCRCSILLGFIMSKKQERLRSELLSEDKITNLLGFLTK